MFQYFIQANKPAFTWKFSLALKPTPKACIDDYNQISVITLVDNYCMNYKLNWGEKQPEIEYTWKRNTWTKMQKHSYIPV